MDQALKHGSFRPRTTETNGDCSHFVVFPCASSALTMSSGLSPLMVECVASPRKSLDRFKKMNIGKLERARPRAG